MKINALTKKEMGMVDQLCGQLCASQGALDQALRDQFGDEGSAVRAELEAGLDQFYQTVQGTVNEETLKGMLEANMEGMTPGQQYTYLTNLMLALTKVCGSVVEGPEWNDALEAYQVVLEGLKEDALDEGSPQVKADIREMVSRVARQADAFSVLLIGEPPYEDLMEACLTADPAEIKALAANTREAALGFSASLYLLQEQGKLESLPKGSVRPRDIAVMTASALEMDAAFKSGSWEKAKETIEKMAKAAVALLVASPSILGEGLMVALMLALFTSLSKAWLLLGGAVLLVNARVHASAVERHLEPILDAGAKVLDVTLDKVRDVTAGFRRWVSEEALPKALPVWQGFRDFVTTKVILPVVAQISRVPERLGAAIHKVKAFFARLKDKALENAAVVDARREGAGDTVAIDEDETSVGYATVEDEDEVIILEP